MLNQCNFIGRVGRDPEVRYTQSGTQGASFSIACSEKFKGKDGEMKEETEWVKVVTWNRLAEICGDMVKKGTLVFISGKMKTRKWQDQSGNDRYSTEIIARKVRMLGGKSEGGIQQQETSGGDSYWCGTGQDAPF